MIIICLDAPKSIRETEKNPKNPLVWAKKPKKTQKNPKNPKKQKKTQKTQKNPLDWVFLKKPGFFPTLINLDTEPAELPAHLKKTTHAGRLQATLKFP